MCGVWGLRLGFGGVVGGLYVHTLVKNSLIMMLFLVAKGCKFDSYQSQTGSAQLINKLITNITNIMIKG